MLLARTDGDAAALAAVAAVAAAAHVGPARRVVRLDLKRALQVE